MSSHVARGDTRGHKEVVMAWTQHVLLGDRPPRPSGRALQEAPGLQDDTPGRWVTASLLGTSGSGKHLAQAWRSEAHQQGP